MKQHSTQVARIQSSQESLINQPDVFRNQILQLRNAIEKGYLKLAELLSQVRHEELYIRWGFKSFADYCDRELAFHERKAEHLIKIWDKVRDFKLDEERIKKIGWTKMRQVVPLLTEKNSKDLINKAENLSVRALGESMKSIRAAERTPSQIILKLPMEEDSQHRIIMDAIQEAKNLCKQSTSQALEMICQDWMASQGARPELAKLGDHVKYLEKIYRVKLKY